MKKLNNVKKYENSKKYLKVLHEQIFLYKPKRFLGQCLGPKKHTLPFSSPPQMHVINTHRHTTTEDVE